MYLTQVLFSKKIKVEKYVEKSLKDTIENAKPIIKLGFVLMMGMVVLTCFTYLTNIFISRYGKIEDLGLFQGVSSIATQSIAIVIAVLASDFFPRLSAVFNNLEKVKSIVNQQIELVAIVIAPILVILISFAPIIIKLLLSNDFILVVPMFRLFSLSLLFRGVWLIMSYTILAHGDKKSYFVYDSIIGNGLLFILNILSYMRWGLFGLGISSLLGSILVSVILFLIVKKKFKFEVEVEVIRILIILTFLAFCSYLATYLLEGLTQYIVSTLTVISTLAFSLFTLNQRIELIDKFKSYFSSNDE